MKTAIIILALLISNQSTLLSQFVPHLWHKNLELKKEEPIWQEMNTQITEVSQGNETEYPVSKIVIGADGSRTVSVYDRNGDIGEVNTGYFENDTLYIYKTEDGNQERKQYDANHNLISEAWVYPDGSEDRTTYTYSDGLLVRIVETDEFDTFIEELQYDGNNLSSINSIDEDGEIVMERKILYDSAGRIVETQRIEDGQINKRVYYSYDESDQLILKEEEKINRLRGGLMAPEVYEYQYHSNGILKEERWIIYQDESKEDINTESISIFNELGLEIKGIYKEYDEGFEEITTYEYKSRD